MLFFGDEGKVAEGSLVYEKWINMDCEDLKLEDQEGKNQVVVGQEENKSSTLIILSDL